MVCFAGWRQKMTNPCFIGLRIDDADGPGRPTTEWTNYAKEWRRRTLLKVKDLIPGVQEVRGTKGRQGGRTRTTIDRETKNSTMVDDGQQQHIQEYNRRRSPRIYLLWCGGFKVSLSARLYLLAEVKAGWVAAALNHRVRLFWFVVVFSRTKVCWCLRFVVWRANQPTNQPVFLWLVLQLHNNSSSQGASLHMCDQDACWRGRLWLSMCVTQVKKTRGSGWWWT